MRTRRGRLAGWWLAGAAVLLLPAGRGVAQEAAGAGAATVDGDATKMVEVTPALEGAVARGLSYLAKAQAPEGMAGAGGWGGQVGISSLACLAFLAHGDLPDRGEYAAVVERGVRFVLESAQETGLISADASHGPMYGHGFATLLLAEVYGQSGDARVREALMKAVRLIVNTQNREGGWRYQPVASDADISVTICQVMALRSARNAGVSVPRETIDRAVAYVRQCQNPGDGGFRYMLSSGGSAFPRSAAGVAALYYAGVYEDDAIARGLEYLLKQSGEGMARGQGHYHYGHYYAAQAMFQAGGRYWAQWFPPVREELIEQQATDGSWTSPHGEAYGTAMSLIVLQVPYRYLPILQR